MLEFDNVSKSFWTGTQRKVILNRVNLRVELGRSLGILAPNGLCLSPDEDVLYIVESRGVPNRRILAYDVAEDGGVQTLGLMEFIAAADMESGTQ